MDLRQLRYFLAVVEHGSFPRAAAMTGRTQQALSKGILSLEQRLGARLFERGAREARPTPVGRLLLEHARAADEAVRSFEERLHELQTGEEGEVRIGTGPTGAHISSSDSRFSTMFADAVSSAPERKVRYRAMSVIGAFSPPLELVMPVSKSRPSTYQPIEASRRISGATRAPTPLRLVTSANRGKRISGRISATIPGAGGWRAGTLCERPHFVLRTGRSPWPTMTHA